MRYFVFMAQAAIQDPDGPYDLKRAGINTFYAKDPTVPKMRVNACAVLLIDHDIGSRGPHSVDFACVNADGRGVGPMGRVSFEIRSDGRGRSVQPISFKAILDPGDYEIRIIDGGQVVDSVTFYVKRTGTTAGSPPSGV